MGFPQQKHFAMHSGSAPGLQPASLATTQAYLSVTADHLEDAVYNVRVTKNLSPTLMQD